MSKAKADDERVRARRGSGESAREYVGTKVSSEDGARLRAWSKLHGVSVSEAVRLAVRRLVRGRCRGLDAGVAEELRASKGLGNLSA